MFSVLWSQLWGWFYIFLFRPFIKRVLHFVTGECELIRIAHGYETGTLRTQRLEKCLSLSRSRYLRGVVSTDTDIDEAVDQVFYYKHLERQKHPLFWGILKVSLLQITGYQQLVAEVEARRKTAFSSDNSEHESDLMKLWNNLNPEVALQSRISSQWTDIGFQGDNPETDFRGMGIFGLDQLVFFTSKYPNQARSLLSHSQHPTKGYFFAIVGINITSLLYHIFKTGALKTHLYNLVPRKPSIRDLHEVFCYLFYEFDSFWIKENPRDIMEFERIKDKFQKEIEEMLQDSTTTLQTPFQKAKTS